MSYTPPHEESAPEAFPESAQKRYQQVASTIASRIQNGIYKIGEKIPTERELAEEFSVSRPTIREALIALEVMGMVHTRQGSGVYALEHHNQDNSNIEFDIGEFELTEARLLFESEAAALAATMITDAQIKALENLIDDMAIENEESGNAERADREFHIKIAQATRNTLIVDTINRLWDIREKSPLCKHMLGLARRLDTTPRIYEHIQILNALKSRDAQAARNAMKNHLLKVIDNLLVATEHVAIEKARADSNSKRQEFDRLKGI